MDEARLIFEYLRPEIAAGLMLDVGAAPGDACGQFLDAGWTVHAFEPDPSNRAELERRLAGRQRLRIVPLAVGEQSAPSQTWYDSAVSRGISSLTPFHESHKAAGKVDVTSLRDYLSQAGVGRVDFLKIDAEGWDLAVLKGFPWEAVRPWAVMCEFEDRRSRPLGFDCADMCRLLRSERYHLILSEWAPVAEYGARHSWRGFAANEAERADPLEGWGNILALSLPWNPARLACAAARAAVQPGPAARPTVVPTPKPPICGPDCAEAARSYVRAVWRGLAAGGARSVFLFGAGRHTEWLWDCVSDLPAPRIAAVLDDNPAAAAPIPGVPVLAAAGTDPADADVVVLSSDTNRERLRARAAALWGPALAVVDIYRDWTGPMPVPKSWGDRK